MTAHKKKTTLNRRNFIARSGTALVPLILGTGCSDNTVGPDVSDPPEPTPEPTPPEPTPPEPIPPEPPADPPPEDPVDVIVVGAGLSGLVAAYELDRAGHDVRVLEASNVIGGRAQTLREPFESGLIAETGPARIPPSHDLTLGYIDHFGIATSPFYTQEGEYLILSDQAVRQRLTPGEFLAGRETWLKIPAGTDALPMAFAAALGDNVRTGSVVTKVVRDENGVVAIYGPAGHELRGSRLICTVPLPVISRIEFDPALSAEKLAAFEATSYQDVTRVYVQYAQRIWGRRRIEWMGGCRIWQDTRRSGIPPGTRRGLGAF